MQRGEIWWVTFGRDSRGKARKTRHAIIVSNDAANQHANHIQVVPLSSKTGRLYPCEARVIVEGRELQAMADQINTVSKHQLWLRVGRLSQNELHCIEIAIRIQLGLAT
jgi:mRNA interferase MazF